MKALLLKFERQIAIFINFTRCMRERVGGRPQTQRQKKATKGGSGVGIA
jgi:hypothetical protein